MLEVVQKSLIILIQLRHIQNHYLEEMLSTLDEYNKISDKPEKLLNYRDEKRKSTPA